MKKIAAGQFKNRCLALMDEVQQTGEPILVTKRGKPVAKVVPVRNADDDFFDCMAGRAKLIGDIVHETVPAEDWDSH